MKTNPNNFLKPFAHGTDPHPTVDFYSWVGIRSMQTNPTNLEPHAAQFCGMNLQSPVPRPELGEADVDPPRCVKTQLRRRVGYCGLKPTAPCTVSCTTSCTKSFLNKQSDFSHFA